MDINNHCWQACGEKPSFTVVGNAIWFSLCGKLQGED